MTIQDMKKMFLEVYGGDDSELRIFESPGRVNLIGEHIDYCGGCVMPAALTMKTTIVARKRNDDVIRLKATDLDIMVETKISEMHNLTGKLKWGDYQIGVALELINAGYDICGCDLLYDDTVPHGGGLSSSAAIEVSTALMFATFANEKAGNTKKIDMIEMALLSQKAEHNFIDVKCGIMDQFASAMGKADHAIYLNCSTLEYEHIPLRLKYLFPRAHCASYVLLAYRVAYYKAHYPLEFYCSYFSINADRFDSDLLVNNADVLYQEI